MKTSRIAVAILAGALLAGPASAQWTGVDRGLGNGLTPRQLQELLAGAMARRMAMERDQVEVEIREGMLFVPDKVDPAVKALVNRPANTWEDNVKRICQAFATVDMRFGKAWAALEAGRCEEAGQIIQPLISERDTSYLAAAKMYCHAEALAGQGKYEFAAEAYADLVKRMPERFSFSSMALLRAAESYEKLHRRYSSMALYKAWVDSFGLLDPVRADALSKKADRIKAEYKDPLKTLASKMGQAGDRLARTDSGRETQRKQLEVVEMLDDLIAMCQKSQCSGQGQGKGRKQGKMGSGQCQGQGQGAGSKKGPAAGIGIPSANATVSQLVGGNSPRPAGLSEIRPSGPGDDWGRLPPRERDKLLETFRENMPERYREMVRDYFRKMAAERNP